MEETTITQTNKNSNSSNNSNGKNNSNSDDTNNNNNDTTNNGTKSSGSANGDETGSASNNNNNSIALCASCDRCRARKTRCDGKKPCGNCAAKYMKKHKLTSTEGIPIEAFECVYSPAKRRGPVPGQARKTNEVTQSSSDTAVAAAVQQGQQHQHQHQLNQQNQQQQQFLSPAGQDWSNNSAAAVAAAALQQSSNSSNFLAGAGAAGGLAALTKNGMMDPAQVAALLSSVQGAATGPAAAAGAFPSLDQTAVRNAFNGNSTAALQLSLLQQQLNQQQQHQQQQQQQQQQNQQQQQQQQLLEQQLMEQEQRKKAQQISDRRDAHNEAVAPPSRRMKVEQGSDVSHNGGSSHSKNGRKNGSIPRTIIDHTRLLERNDPEGARLRAYYRLSIDEMFRLPATPTDEEFCARLKVPGMTPQMIPGSHLAALSAARFAEVALGAVVHNEVGLAMELCNAVVHCLRESVQEPVQEPVLFEVSKAYFLLGVFRACRGDMVRYFKYRRVCLTFLTKLETDSKVQILLAAVSFLDSWAYMIYNANEKLLPQVDDTIPPIAPVNGAGGNSESKFDARNSCCAIACDPKNKNWIQGAPPVYLNNEAPLHARALDALACAVRTCCDQANSRFAAIHSANGGNDDVVPTELLRSPTSTAVLANENELCSRNMVLSAYALMQQLESSSRGRNRNEGQHLVISAMDAFLENSAEAENGGFTDSQIQSLLSVCNTAIENPMLLHHAGPTYHMVTNAAILICHLMNGMHAMRGDNEFGAMEKTLFDEVLDTYIAVRKLLTMHRRKLPVKLRCHGMPRVSMDNAAQKVDSKKDQPFIDLGETLLCPCRGCQGFVLMACSPCVAAERGRTATQQLEMEAAQEAEAMEVGELDRELDELGAEFDLDDDALLNMISSIITS